MAPRELHVLLLLCGCFSPLLALGNSTTAPANNVTEHQSVSQSSTGNGTSMINKDNKMQLSGNGSSAAPNAPTLPTSSAPLNSTTVTNSTTAFSTSNETITHVTSPTPESHSTENSTQTVPLPTNPNRNDTNSSAGITEKPTVSTHWSTDNTTALPQGESSTQRNPGLIAVLCIFISILAIVIVVVVVKFCQNREPAFKKLDEVPMNSVNEDAPFARYPPK